MRHMLCLTMMCGLLLLCTACGKRPDNIDAPEGAAPGQYPRTYPDLSTDPAGVLVPKP